MCVTWRLIPLHYVYTADGDSGVVEGSVLNLVAVQRRQMAAYLCIGKKKKSSSIVLIGKQNEYNKTHCFKSFIRRQLSL